MPNITQTNRNTGEFIDNIDWWFWNGSKFPGLLTREQFSKVADEVLGVKTRAELSSLLVQDSIVSSFARKKPHPRLNILLKEMSAYLEGVAADSPNATLINILDNTLDALRAYLNILEYWGYGYSWQTIGDLRGRDALLIKRNEKQLLCVNAEEIQYIQGRPFRFEVAFKGVSLHFNENDRIIKVLQRNYQNGTLEVEERWLA